MVGRNYWFLTPSCWKGLKNGCLLVLFPVGQSSNYPVGQSRNYYKILLLPIFITHHNYYPVLLRFKNKFFINEPSERDFSIDTVIVFYII